MRVLKTLKAIFKGIFAYTLREKRKYTWQPKGTSLTHVFNEEGKFVAEISHERNGYWRAELHVTVAGWPHVLGDYITEERATEVLKYALESIQP